MGGRLRWNMGQVGTGASLKPGIERLRGRKFILFQEVRAWLGGRGRLGEEGLHGIDIRSTFHRHRLNPASTFLAQNVEFCR